MRGILLATGAYVILGGGAVLYISAVNWGTDYSAWRSWGMTCAYGIQIGFLLLVLLIICKAYKEQIPGRKQSGEKKR